MSPAQKSKLFFFNPFLGMNTKFFNYVWKTGLVFLSVVFFPLGLFLLGYVIGSNKGKKKFIVDEKNPSKLIEEKVLSEANMDNEEKVVI